VPEIENTACPSHAELVAFSLGNVSQEALETIAEHLETCESCATALSTVRDSGDWLLSGLRRVAGVERSGPPDRRISGGSGTNAARRCPLDPGHPMPDDANLEVLSEQCLAEPEYRQAVERVQALGCGPSSSERSARQALQPVPSVLGRYEIIEELGHGGMGTVYLARDTLLGREVALKIPHFRRSDDLRRLAFYGDPAGGPASLDSPRLRGILALTGAVATAHEDSHAGDSLRTTNVRRTGRALEEGGPNSRRGTGPALHGSASKGSTCGEGPSQTF
jgi:hypothetical protein